MSIVDDVGLVMNLIVSETSGERQPAGTSLESDDLAELSLINEPIKAINACDLSLKSEIGAHKLSN